MDERRTSIRTEARGMRNVWVVECVGTVGTATLYARSLTEARYLARKYAGIVNSPAEVL